MPQRNPSTAKSDTAPSVRHDTEAAPEAANGGMIRRTTVQTRYMDMLLDLDKVPQWHNILAWLFGWLLLAGFVVFPGTFTHLDQVSQTPGLASALLNGVQSLPLLIVGAVACGTGTLGLLCLALRWRRNYVWLLNNIFLPCAINAFTGLISTLVTVYTQKSGQWSVMAAVTGAAEAGNLLVCGCLFGLGSLMLHRVKRKHGREVEAMGSLEAREYYPCAT